MCRMPRRSFWCEFDVNRPTFYEDMRENDFYIFVPNDLDLWTFFLKNTSPFTCVRINLSIKYKLCMVFQWVTKRYVTDRQTNMEKWRVSTKELYMTIYTKWVDDHCGLSLKICVKRLFYVFLLYRVGQKNQGHFVLRPITLEMLNRSLPYLAQIEVTSFWTVPEYI